MNVRADTREAGTVRTDGEIRFTVGDSSLGRVLVARSAQGLSAVLLGDEDDALKHEFQERFRLTTPTAADEEMEALAVAVVAFLDSPADTLDVPLDLRGTGFQRSVWQALREIPAGETASYTEIARRIGRPRGVRAVARACAANALAVVVPCHRVVRSDGGLGGYRWGMVRKRLLLEREGVM